MDAAQKLEPRVSDVLTWAEICQRYPHQHVVLTQVVRTRRYSLKIHTARVVAYGHDRRSLFEQMQSLHGEHHPIGMWFTGPVTRFLFSRVSR
jgi:hypothetical protein